MNDARAAAGTPTRAGAIAEFRVGAGTDLRSAIDSITAAIAAARADGTACQLVDTRALSGTAAPGLGLRHAFASDWARAADGALSLAMLAPPDHVDPGHFGVLVAQAAGLDCEVFADEAAARAWLARRRALRP